MIKKWLLKSKIRCLTYLFELSNISDLTLMVVTHGYDSGYNRHATGLHDLQVLFGQDATHLAVWGIPADDKTHVSNKHTELQDLFGSFNPNEHIYIYEYIYI